MPRPRRHAETCGDPRVHLIYPYALPARPLRRQALGFYAVWRALRSPNRAVRPRSRNARQDVTAIINSSNRWFTPELASHGTNVPQLPRFVTTKFRLGMKMTISRLKWPCV